MGDAPEVEEGEVGATDGAFEVAALLGLVSEEEEGAGVEAVADVVAYGRDCGV